jgi:hypothetical protein
MLLPVAAAGDKGSPPGLLPWRTWGGLTKSESLLARSVGRFVGPWVRRARGESGVLGRFKEKFEEAGDVLDSIRRRLERLREDFREPESSGGIPKVEKKKRGPGKRARAMELDAKKLKFEMPPCFGGEAYLEDPDLASICRDPKMGRKPRDE